MCPALTRVPQMSLLLLAASSSQLQAARSLSSLLTGPASPNHSEGEAHVQQKPGVQSPPAELLLGTVAGWLLPPAQGTHGSHLTGISVTLGGYSSMRWPKATTIFFPGFSPTGHSSAWDFRLWEGILDPLGLCQLQGQVILTTGIPGKCSAQTWRPTL